MAIEIKIEDTTESISEAIQTGITTPALVVKWLDYEGIEAELIDDIVIPHPEIWQADDGNCEVDCECESGYEAAEKYADGGEWGDRDKTIYIDIAAWQTGVNASGEIVRVNEERHVIALDPIEPLCKDGQDHDWQSPIEIVGGITENPGVWGHGGGIIIEEVCMNCGCARITDTWAQNPETGKQGLESVEYVPEKYTDMIPDQDKDDN